MHRLAILLVSSGCDLALGIAKDPARVEDAQPGCMHGASFGPAEPVDLGSAFSVEAVRFNPQQTLAFIALASIPPTGPIDYETTDLYVASVMDGAIQSHNKLGGLSSPLYDSYPTLTRDGEHMIYGSKRSGTQRLVVGTAVDHGFDMATVTVLDLAGGMLSNEPYALAGADVLYFEAGDIKGDLYRADHGPTAFADVSAVGGINTAFREDAPVVSDDELEIFFASDRDNPTAPSVTGLDIFTATRTSRSEDFAAPERIAALSSDDVDYPVWLSPDNCELYFIQKLNLVGTLYRVHR